MVMEIEKAIEALPAQEFRVLVAWLEVRKIEAGVMNS